MAERQKAVYQADTETIRQQPENYQLAIRHGGRWFSDPDLACNQRLAVKVFLALFDRTLLYGCGDNIIKAIYK